MGRNYQFEVTGRLESFRNSFMTLVSRCKNAHCQRDFFFASSYVILTLLSHNADFFVQIGMFCIGVM